MPKMREIALSVFLPCYNEELNLEDLVIEVVRVLRKLVQEYEILIVNDGSTDRTGLIADRLNNQYKVVRVVHHQTNKGYGAALISGFSNCICEWVFFTDSDNQFFMNEIEMLINEIDDFDLIIGYRKKRRDPWYRILYGYAWARLVQILFDLRVKDINCAFKLIKKKALDDIELHSSGATINTELLVKMKLSGARVKEVGVSHRPRLFGTQTGGNPKVVVKAFVELLKLWRELKG